MLTHLTSSRRAGFSLFNVLIALSVFAAAYYVVSPSAGGHGRRKQTTHLWAMRSALERLADAQENYFSEHQTYTSDLSKLDSEDFYLGPVSLSVLRADNLSWTATAGHKYFTSSCETSRRRASRGASPDSALMNCTEGTSTQAGRDLQELSARVGGPLDKSVPIAPAKCSRDSLGGLPPVLSRRAANQLDLGYPTETIDQLAVRQLLYDRSYDALDSLLTAYTDSARRDFRM
jgi:type II secretory pathway pseudopilin PulG